MQYNTVQYSLVQCGAVQCSIGHSYSKDLAKREFEDLKNNSVIGEAQFRQRAAQILNSYSVPEPGQRHSYLQKLVRGIPARLAKCKKNKYGRCGK